MSNLASVWPEVKNLLSDKVSLIPVHDKDFIDAQGKLHPPKTACGLWTKAQSHRATEGQLWSSMAHYNTEAVAMVCGTISGGIEVIDVDVKYKPGIDALLLKDIQTLYPDIYTKLRIHRTPSKGCHIIYRIADHEIPGSTKLAGRPATEEEIQAQIDAGKKKIMREVNFLETRAEKSYILIPPSMGYSVVQNVPIPTITWEERCSLINLCHTYTELVKPAIVPKPPKTQEDQYTTNPFEAYNEEVDLIDVLTEYGWDLLSENSDRYMFTRPGKDSGVSATWNKENRCFFVFTSSTEFEPSKGYNPSTVLSILKFEGDKSKTLKYLSEQGYGTFKPWVEDNLVRKCALSKKELPGNISDEGKQKYEELKKQYNDNLPYGRFWNYAVKADRFEISREDLYFVAHELGYRLHNKIEIIRIHGQKLEKQSDKDFFNVLKLYIWDSNLDTRTQIYNSFEAFLQKSGNFTITRLQDLDKETVLKDGPDYAYKYFSNGVLKITADKTTLFNYGDFHEYIWAHNIKNRKWNADEPGTTLYQDYLQNAIGITPYLKRVIGYLAHEYKSEASGYLIALTEKTLDPKDGGGSGKNIFGNILSGTTTIKTVPGSSVKFEGGKFLAAWNNERIYFLADIPKKIDWIFLKEMITGTGYVDKKYIAEYDVPSEEMPKILLNTNYSYDDVDGGLKRRIRQVEFSNYYTTHGGVDAVHGKMFPSDFDDLDWAGYDHFMVESIQELFKAKGKLEAVELSDEGWMKKFSIQHHDTTLEFFQENIAKWCETGFITNIEFKEHYIDFANEQGIQPKYRKETKNLTTALKDFCQHYKISLEVNKIKRTPEGILKGKIFGPCTIEDLTDISDIL